ncbi:MAG: bacteriocin family protein [Phycisphaerales bacterium]|nr:bacteriocin family protein [Phycisphaerales bacterium]
MTDLLKRNLAPITEAGWQEIDATAAQVIKTQLSARSVVDFSGPHGWEMAAVNLGRLEVPKKKGEAKIPWGLRQVLPLVETRVHFSLNQWEIDNISRGCKDADLSALEATARQVAHFEESAVYNGFPDGNIAGLLPSCSHKPIKLPASVDQYAQCIGEAVKTLDQAGVGGPYALVLGSKAYYPLKHNCGQGYPLGRVIKELLQGNVLWSPVLAGGVVLSTRGGDFELVVGQDFSIGYACHDKAQVELFLTESFTFRVINPDAAIELKA